MKLLVALPHSRFAKWDKSPLCCLANLALMEVSLIRDEGKYECRLHMHVHMQNDVELWSKEMEIQAGEANQTQRET